MNYMSLEHPIAVDEVEERASRHATEFVAYLPSFTVGKLYYYYL